MSSWGVQRNLDAVIGSDGSSAENSPENRKKRKGKKKLVDREDYSASIYSSDGESESGTDAGSVVPDKLPTDVIKKTKKGGLISALAQDYAEKLDENYCGLCGTIHEPGVCHMVQNADNLAEYRAMLIEVTNEESIESRVSGLAGNRLRPYSLAIQREAIQAIDEKLLKMGKVDIIKGQPVYLADNSNKRKKPHESDKGENTTELVKKVKKPRKPRQPRNTTTTQIGLSKPWKVLNREALVSPSTSTIPTVLALPPTFDATTMANGSKGLGSSFSTNPLRPAKKAKVSTFSTLASAGDSRCPLCSGPKHDLSDCPAPKGGIEQ